MDRNKKLCHHQSLSTILPESNQVWMRSNRVRPVSSDSHAGLFFYIWNQTEADTVEALVCVLLLWLPAQLSRRVWCPLHFFKGFPQAKTVGWLNCEQDRERRFICLYVTVLLKIFKTFVWNLSDPLCAGWLSILWREMPWLGHHFSCRHTSSTALY